MKSIVCPNCFSTQTADKFYYFCTRTGCARNGLAIPEEEVKLINGRPACPSCENYLNERLCPECGYALFIEDSSIPNISVSIIGTEGCGKSNYLSVVIEELKRSFSKAYDCALYPIGGDNTIHHYEKLYYNPIYLRRECLTSTQQDEIVPLLYSLIFSDKNSNGKNCNLTFYDACGENFKSEKVMADYNSSIFNAKGLLYFIDPSQFPLIREDYESQGKKVCEDDASNILSRTVRLIRHAEGNKNLGQKIDIPIAVCVTKFDTLRSYLDASSFISYQSRHLSSPQFDFPDFNSTNYEVQSLIESWNGTEIVNQVRSHFSNYAFFGISSLGASPDENNRLQQIIPHRVLDPILWILWKNNIINS